MNISEISGTMVSDPSTATNQIIVNTGDGLQRAIATSAVSGTIVSDESIETTDCIVDTGSGLQRAIKTAGSGGGLKFLKMLNASDATVTGENTFTVEFPKELPDLSVETYIATFTFDNGAFSATATKDGEDVGSVGVYVQLVPYDTSVSTFQRLPALTLNDNDQYVCQIGDNTCSFDISIADGAVSIVGEYSKDGEIYGDCDIYWEVKEPASE